ncbi:MAG: hypothetical protein HZA79_05635 [Sphingobacteriales bacterium]|nr:hypothetical protein [Sphingobacteriales bacterium]
MPEINKREKQLAWICRVLITLDLLVVTAGYLSFFQAKRQLSSPLIPASIRFQIINDSYIFRASLLAAVFFLAGLWFYSFNKKGIAILLFTGALLGFRFYPF